VSTSRWACPACGGMQGVEWVDNHRQRCLDCGELQPPCPPMRADGSCPKCYPLPALDPSNPAHAAALACAARFHVRWPHVAKRIVEDLPTGLADLPEAVRVDGLAHRTLSSPSDSAAIVRALLEGCGVSASVQRTGQPHGDRTATVWIWWTPKDGDGPAYITLAIFPDEKTLRYRTMQQVLALILALLASTNATSAIAALREAGR
jgi:hypothetical protein